MSRLIGCFILSFTLSGTGVMAQRFKPGLEGMTPSKWIRLETTHAPGRIYCSNGGAYKEYQQEDLYFKIYLPVFHKPNFTLMLGPSYRMEQFQLDDEEDTRENPLRRMSDWNLRSLGVDIKAINKISDAAWLMTNLNINQSGNLRDDDVHAPLNYTLSAVYLKKHSGTREVGVGFMVNQSFGRMVAFPAFVFNYNFSSKVGAEVMLPRRIALRYNVSPSDILLFKAEALSRSYYITDTNVDYAFRRTELDLGLEYNKQLGGLLGVEVFGGYRQNISTRLPNEISAIKTSGLVFSVGLYVKPPVKR